MAKKTAKKDYDKDGKLESPSEEMVSESSGIVKFINAISSKNYAQANKYLKGIIESKLEKRITQSLNEPLF